MRILSASWQAQGGDVLFTRPEGSANGQDRGFATIHKISHRQKMTGIKTYSLQISEYIKQAILDGELNPGDKVNEVHLASRLSISRAPVREALQMLVQDGLIVSIPQRGKFIAALTEKEIQDSYFIGGVLEGAVVASTINEFTEEDFRKLQVILEQMKHLAENGGKRELLAPLDNQFHDILFSKTDNSLIVHLSRRSCRGVSKFLLFKYWREIFTTKEVYERHKVIFDVLRGKDPMAIEQCLREHYIDAGRRMKRYGVDKSATDY
jgi:DNA-binding GntR family transcriptional regulator